MTPRVPSKEERERIVFAHFGRAAGLLPGGSFSSRPPREPDILYVAKDGTHLAFELVEIIDQDYKASVGQTFSMKDACNAFLDGIENAAAFRQAFSDADIAFDFGRGMSEQRRRNALPAIFKHLMQLPPGFKGDVFADGNPLAALVDHLYVYRGVVGPLFNDSSAIWVDDPTVDAIEGKMVKTYEPQGQLNLLAYIDTNPMFPEEVWLGRLDTYLATLDARCQFANVFVYDCNASSIRRTWVRPAQQLAHKAKGT